MLIGARTAAWGGGDVGNIANEILHLDALSNQGIGAARNLRPSTWVDLSSAHNNASLMVSSGNVFNDHALTSPSSTVAYKLSGILKGMSEYSIIYCLDDSAVDSIIFTSRKGVLSGLQMKSRLVAVFNNGFKGEFNCNNGSSHFVIMTWKSGSPPKFWKDDLSSFITISQLQDAEMALNAESDYFVTGCYTASGFDFTQNMKASLNSIRVFSRELSVEELLKVVNEERTKYESFWTS